MSLKSALERMRCSLDRQPVGDNQTVAVKADDLKEVLEAGEHLRYPRFKIEEPVTVLEMPNHGEDSAVLMLMLPSGERVDVFYKAFGGLIEVFTYEPKEGGEFDGFKAKPTFVTNMTDKLDADGNVTQQMCDAPKADGCREHVRIATQVCISVKDISDDDEPSTS